MRISPATNVCYRELSSKGFCLGEWIERSRSDSAHGVIFTVCGRLNRIALNNLQGPGYQDLRIDVGYQLKHIEKLPFLDISLSLSLSI